MNEFNKPDELIKDEVKERLLFCGDVDAHNFDIQVESGIVRLDGEVPGRHAKRSVEECLVNIPGVRSIENCLKIRRVCRFSDNSMHGF